MSRNALKVLVKKEVRELIRNPKIVILMILIPSIIFVMMGNLVTYTTHKTLQAAMQKANVLVVNDDEGWASNMLIQTLKMMGNATVTVASGLIEKFLSITNPHVKYDVIVYIPRGFTENITRGVESCIEIYSVVKGLSLSATARTQIATAFINAFRENIVKEWLEKAYPSRNPNVMLHPFIVKQYAILAGRKMPYSIVASLYAQSALLFIGPFILLSLAASIAAASMGVEKEQKTLETLLSLPVKRSQILVSKVVGSLVVAAIGTAAMAGGLIYYALKIGSAVSMGGVGAKLSLIDIVRIFGAGNILLAVAGIFVVLTFVLVLSLIIASLASNIREAQAIAGYIWLPVFIPVFILMYIEYSSLSQAARILLTLLPFATPILALKSAVEGYMWIPLASILINMAYTLVIIYVGAKFFEGEKILTGRLRRPGAKRPRGFSLTSILYRRCKGS